MAIDLSAKGRLEVHPFVNDAKVEAMSLLISESQRGGFKAEKARVRVRETLATTDGVFSLAHLANIRNLPEYDAAPREWTKIASTETVDDFKPQSFQRLVPNLDKLKFGKGNKGKPGIAPRVAELDTYQYAYGYAEESVKLGVEKRGFKFGISLEEIINDASRKIRQLPGDMLNVALDTDEFLVFDSLQSNAAAGTQLKAGTFTPTNTPIVANAPFSAEAARLALSQVAKRKDTLTNRNVVLAPSYYVVVATGNGEIVEAELERARSLVTLQDGVAVYKAPSQGNLSKITGVIESEYIDSETAWYLVPAAGSTRRPSLVRVQLAGYTAPEILVNNFTGVPISGGSSSPFQLAHFDNDSVDLKLRMFTNAALVTQDQLVWSTGLGA